MNQYFRSKSACKKLQAQFFYPFCAALCDPFVPRLSSRPVGVFLPPRRAAETAAKGDLLELCPSLAKSSVEAAVKRLVDSGELVKHGTGRATFYVQKDAIG